MASIDEQQSDVGEWVDPIVDEVRSARDALAASNGYDLDRIVAVLTERTRASGRATVSLVLGESAAARQERDLEGRRSSGMPSSD